MEMIHGLIGRDGTSIEWWQMVIRAILIFLYTLLLVRCGGRRIFGRYTSFDIVLSVILGSIMSRAITGNARFFPTLAAATVLVCLHWLIAVLAQRSSAIGFVFKGHEIQLVANGRILEDALSAANLTEHDLRESLRCNAGTAEIADVEAAYLERNGKISVILR